VNRVLVFDLDDTLFPEHEYVRSGFGAVSVWLAQRIGKSSFEAVAWRLFVEGFRGDVFNRALEELGAVHDARLIQELVEVYRNHTPSIELYADARWALDRFRRLTLGIISDGPAAAQSRKISALGIGDQFDMIVLTDEFGRDYWKPAPFAFEKVMNHFKVHGKDCIYVGDNPAKDFVTAHRLGWKTIRILRVGGEYADLIAKPGYEADAVLDSLYDLEEHVLPDGSFSQTGGQENQ